MNVTNNEESDDVLYDIREREFDFFINFAMPYMFLALGKFFEKSSKNNELAFFGAFGNLLTIILLCGQRAIKGLMFASF